MQDISEKMRSSAKETAEKAAETAKDVGEKISSGVKQSETTLESATKQIKEQSEELYNSVIDCFKKNPITSVVIALLAGTLIGNILSK